MRDFPPSSVLVIGVGNELRGDDAAGVQVARRVRSRLGSVGIEVEEEQNDPTALLERWQGREAVVLVDAVRGRPGAIHRLDASQRPLPHGLRRSASSHAVGVDEAIELGRALGKLPARVIVYAVGGRHFQAGGGLSDELAAVLPELTDRVLAEALRLAAPSSGTP